MLHREAEQRREDSGQRPGSLVASGARTAMSAGFTSNFNAPFIFEFTRTRLSALLWHGATYSQFQLHSLHACKRSVRSFSEV